MDIFIKDKLLTKKQIFKTLFPMWYVNLGVSIVLDLMIIIGIILLIFCHLSTAGNIFYLLFMVGLIIADKDCFTMISALNSLNFNEFTVEMDVVTDFYQKFSAEYCYFIFKGKRDRIRVGPELFKIAEKGDSFYIVTVEDKIICFPVDKYDLDKDIQKVYDLCLTSC